MTATALDWDAWRNAYHALTYAQQQDFHSAIYKQHPIQSHYDEALAARAIEDTQPRTVVELGGWDGELALLLLEHYPTIQEWTNVEICEEAAEAGNLRADDLDLHLRYHAPILDDYYWTKGPWTCDLFVASHSIEHLSLNHLNETLAATKARALYLDAPLEDHAYQWRGFTGTHILETGWHGITDLCAKHGYALTWAEDHATDPSSGGQARACLYTAKGGP